MADPPVARGRGALLEMLKKHKEMKMGRAGVPGHTIEEQLPPKSRGRAQLLQKIQKMKEKEMFAGDTKPQIVGAGLSSGVSQPKIGVEKFTETLSEVTVSEPVPFRGTQGAPLRATANYVRLEVEKDRGVFEYEVRFQPEIDNRGNRVKLVNQSLGEMSTTKVYDGDVCLYLPSQILTDRQEFDSTIPNTEDPVKTIIIYKRKRKMAECLHLYNVLFMRIMHILLYKKIGRNYFSADHKQLVPQHKLEVLPGFAVHVDEMEGGLMVCLDTQHRVIRSQTVYELFHELKAVNPRNFKQEAYRNLVGACVLTRYNNKTYRIDDIDWDATPRSEFDTRDGGKCTFVDYYKHQHNLTIHDLDQPLLINLQRRKFNDVEIEHRISLIPELSFLTGLTDAMRADFKMMKDVAMFTRVTPYQRALALRTWLQRVQETEMARRVLSGWGLKLASATADVQARVLPQETVFFGGGEDRKFCGPDWSKALADNKITGPRDFNSWQLYFTRRDQRYAANFAETIIRLSKGMGCVIRNPHNVMLEDDRNESYMAAIRDNVKANTEVAVFICPTIRADRYAIIKKMCCINLPIASQVVLSKTLANAQKVRTIIHKIAMQITCKMGGTLWNVKIPATNWMICGIDVYHGSNKQSVCGFVASTDDAAARYYSEALFQEGEIGDFFKMAFRRALQKSFDRRGAFPGKVIVFRDGVGDGQLEHCRRYEITQFLEVIRELNLETTLTYVVIQKRINTRIFSVSGEGQYENPPPGTVVDSVVTRRNFADFFLIPQNVRQGTVNPTHYIILHNDSTIKADHLQRLAYKLCHIYYNWSGTIKVPAPCLYAHKLAAIVGQHLKKLPGAKLNDRLWFL